MAYFVILLLIKKAIVALNLTQFARNLNNFAGNLTCYLLETKLVLLEFDYFRWKSDYHVSVKFDYIVYNQRRVKLIHCAR